VQLLCKTLPSKALTGGIAWRVIVRIAAFLLQSKRDQIKSASMAEVSRIHQLTRQEMN
jgi:hypothetical protein